MTAHDWAEEAFRRTLPEGVPLPWEAVLEARYTHKPPRREAQCMVRFADGSRGMFFIRQYADTPDAISCRWDVLQQDMDWNGTEWVFAEKGAV